MWDIAPSRRKSNGTIRNMTAAQMEVDVDHGQLVAAVAHELRYPLVPIRNAAALLKHAATDTATVHRAAGIIERQASGMNRLIGDLVEVSRTQRGVMEICRARAALSDLLECTTESAEPLVGERGQTLTVHASPQPIYLLMDVLRVAQALLNIIANATKYTDRHGHISMHAQRERAHAVITVSDGGIGIPSQDLETIFGLFAKSSQGMRTEEGLGVGLYLARFFIEAHGGTVTAASTGAGRGSVFTVRLPCEVPNGESSAGGAAPPAGPIPA
jgi:signal transduction histidine kinase